jgi:hypothetical protein
MSAPFGHTIVPSSSSTRTCRKSSGSLRSGSKHRPPELALEIDFPLRAVLEGKSKHEPGERLHRADAGDRRPRTHANGSIVASGWRALAFSQFASSSERWSDAHSRTSRRARGGALRRAARASRSRSAPGIRRRRRGSAGDRGLGLTSKPSCSLASRQSERACADRAHRGRGGRCLGASPGARVDRHVDRHDLSGS